MWEFATPLDRSTVQPRSQGPLSKLERGPWERGCLQFKSSMDQRQGKWTHSSRSLYNSSLQWINAKVNGSTALALQFKSSMDQRQGQWKHSSRSTVQQCQGATQISRNGRKISIPTDRKRSDHKFTRSILIGRRASYA